MSKLRTRHASHYLSDDQIRARVVTAAALVVGAVIWVLVNGPVEGKVLVVLDRNHGITVADLLSVAAVLVAGQLLLSTRRR